MIPSQLAVATHKAYRLRDAIKQLEEEIKTNPSRQPALDSFRELLMELELYGQEKKDGKIG